VNSNHPKAELVCLLEDILVAFLIV
jgi:hypothetical protein